MHDKNLFSFTATWRMKWEFLEKLLFVPLK